MKHGTRELRNGIKERNIGHLPTFMDGIFGKFLLVLKISSFRREDRALGYNSLKFLDFPDISKFPKILSLEATWEATLIYHVY